MWLKFRLYLKNLKNVWLLNFILGHNIHIASIRVTLQHFSYLLHRPSLLLELGVSNWWLLLKRQEMFVKQYCLFPFETFSEKKTAKIGLTLFSPRGVTLSIFFFDRTPNDTSPQCFSKDFHGDFTRHYTFILV